MLRAPLAVTLTLTLTVVACGGDDTATTDTASASTAAPTTTETLATEPPVTEAPPSNEAETTTTAPSFGTLLDVAAAEGQFGTFLAAVEAAGLTEQLSGGQITVLAPTDAAFEALGGDAVDALLADPARLAEVLEGHVLPSPQDAELIAIFNNVLAVNGVSWDVSVDDTALRIGPATVVIPDLVADNGILHGIDAVLLPTETPGG